MLAASTNKSEVIRMETELILFTQGGRANVNVRASTLCCFHSRGTETFCHTPSVAFRHILPWWTDVLNQRLAPFQWRNNLRQGLEDGCPKPALGTLSMA